MTPISVENCDYLVLIQLPQISSALGKFGFRWVSLFVL